MLTTRSALRRAASRESIRTTVTVVVGNPKRASRTLDAATRVARALRPEREPAVIDLIDFGAALLDGGDPSVTRP